uniref:Uncharacterized protein n=1 Tax=Micrurus corallinus TaxID=54390 RepID=A0A2D4GQK8_MICCO
MNISVAGIQWWDSKSFTAGSVGLAWWARFARMHTLCRRAPNAPFAQAQRCLRRRRGFPTHLLQARTLPVASAAAVRHSSVLLKAAALQIQRIKMSMGAQAGGWAQQQSGGENRFISAAHRCYRLGRTRPNR